MNKNVLAAAVVASSVLLITPKLTSNYIEKNTLNIIDAINAVPLYKAELISSDFGWLSSSAKVKVSLDIPAFESVEQTQELFGLDLALNFNHGVLLSSGSNLSDFSITVENKPDISGLEWDRSMPLYQVEGSYSLVGNLSFVDQSPQLSFKDELGKVFQLSSYRGQAETVNGQLRHSGNLAKFSIESLFYSVHVNDVEINTLLVQPLQEYFNYDSVPAYESSLEVANWSVKTQDRFDLNVDNLSMMVASIIDEEKALTHGKIAYGIKQAQLDDYNLSDFELVLETNNLDEESYLKFRKLMAFQSLTSTKMERAEEITAFFQQNIVKFLAAGPEVNITSLKGKLEQGSFDANFHTKVENVTEVPADLTELPFWLSHLNVSSDVKVAKSLVNFIATKVIRNRVANNPNAAGATQEELDQMAIEQAPVMIEMLIAQGFLVDDNEFYTLKLQLANQVAKVNSTEIPLPQ